MFTLIKNFALMQPCYVYFTIKRFSQFDTDAGRLCAWFCKWFWMVGPPPPTIEVDLNASADTHRSLGIGAAKTDTAWVVWVRFSLELETRLTLVGLFSTKRLNAFWKYSQYTVQVKNLRRDFRKFIEETVYKWTKASKIAVREEKRK